MKFPFDEFIIKVASRCNLNCDYCYEYNLGDQSWRTQPRFMTRSVADQTARRIREHAERHSIKRVSLLFHGGEPLIVGLRRLGELVASFREVLEPDVRISFGVQTNGTLLSREFLDFLEAENFGVGLSVDGPPEINDRHRLTHVGGGAGAAVDRALRLLRGSPSFTGTLCVIEPESEPLNVWDYLASFDPPLIDFLLPHATWDRRPPCKDNDAATPYADWLIPIFDTWFGGSHSQIRVRYFEEIIRHTLGGRGTLETLGLEPATLLVIAANGDYEGVDTLKAVVPGAHVLGMNIYAHTLDEVLDHPKVSFRQLGATVLAEQCRTCQYLDTCGGGYLPHRYGRGNGFTNPSIYCADITKLIGHIRERIVEEVRDSCPLKRA